MPLCFFSSANIKIILQFYGNRKIFIEVFNLIRAWWIWCVYMHSNLVESYGEILSRIAIIRVVRQSCEHVQRFCEVVRRNFESYSKLVKSYGDFVESYGEISSRTAIL